MNKVLMLTCIIASSFVSAMEQSSSRQPSPRPITPLSRVDSPPRSRKLSHPAERIKALQSSGSGAGDAELSMAGVNDLFKRRSNSLDKK